jgi:uncharacterized protein (DUF58 family)
LYRLTPLSRISLALTAFTLLLVLIFRNHLLVYTLVLFVTLNTGLFLWSLLSTRGLSVHREHPATCMKGFPLGVDLVITNKLRTARFSLVGYDYFPAAREGEQHREIALLSLAPGSSAAVRYEALPARRGKFEIGPFMFYSGDPLGFFRHVRAMSVMTPLTVFPRPLDTRVNYLNSSSMVPKDELATVPFSGESTEFLGVTEYQPGDPLRKVHWASTARMGKLITKQFERNVASTMSVLLVNDDRSAVGRSEEHNPLEYSITLISTLARETSRSNYYFSFLELSGAAERHCSGMGSSLFQEISLLLAEITPGENLDLKGHSTEILRYLPESSDLIVFIPHLGGGEAEFLANLRLHYRLLSVITFDVDSFRKGMARRTPRSRVSFGQNFLIFELAYGDDLSRQLETFVEKVGFVR